MTTLIKFVIDKLEDGVIYLLMFLILSYIYIANLIDWVKEHM